MKIKFGGTVRMENAAPKNRGAKRGIHVAILCFLILVILFAPFLALHPLANSSLFPLGLIAWYSGAFTIALWKLSCRMALKPTKKKLAYIVVGGLLFSVCGLLLMFSLIISWYPPWYDFSTFLKFVFNPVTLLFFLGAWLIYRGLALREK